MAGRGLDPILRPRSVAVVGASRAENAVGHQVVANLVAHGFQGPVYPVNPRAAAICSIRAHASIGAVGEPIDLAVIAIPCDRVLDAVEECAAAGVRGLVVLSAGFGEIGAEGAARELRLRDVVRGHGLRMVGPNCLGVLNTAPDVSLDATFGPVMPPGGKIAFVSQSGALGLSVLDYAREYELGIAQFVSVGNKADVSGNDLLEYWEDDPTVETILMYVESFGNPQRFRTIAARVSRRKPIIALKAGRSRAGARAAGSHTGALANNELAVDALLAQSGVLRAGSVEELFDVAMAFGPRPLPRSKRTAVVTNSGGPGILAADALDAQGLELPRLAGETIARLRPILPREAALENPVDLIATVPPDRYAAALEAVLADPQIDAALAIFVPPMGGDQEAVAGAVARAAAAHPDKTVLAVLMGRQGLPQGRARLHQLGIPAYVFPESAARALAALGRQRAWVDAPLPGPAPVVVDRDAAAALLSNARAAGRARLDELEALELLGAYGIPTAPARVARTPGAAAEAAGELGFPVVMKACAPELVHKTEAGGVRVGVDDEEEARAAFDAVVAAARAHGVGVETVLVQKQARGRELAVGFTRDPLFGPLVMLGLGGVYIEAVRDVAFRLPPIAPSEADAMARGLRGAAILGAVRGQPAVDRAALADAVVRVGQLALDLPAVAELDVNPLFADETGVVAADARVILTAEAADE